MSKKNPKALAKVRFDRFEEGQSAQIMHLGPFATEHDNIIRLHDHIHASHHTENGRHHEIYRGDFRKVAPEKMKTVLRQPFC